MKHVINVVNRLLFAFAWLVALVGLSGCGGGGISLGDLGEISGNVVDFNGDPVRDAVVTSSDGTQTVTNSSGAYVLTNVRPGMRTVRASINITDVPFSAQTVVQVFEGERTKSVNLTLVREADQARIFGVVRDRFGNIIQGAHVFAYREDKSGFTLGSTSDISDSNGEFEIRTLASGFTYTINGSALGYGNDRSQILLKPGEARRHDITLGDAFDPLLPPPANLTAIAWTSPDPGQFRGNALAAVRRRIAEKFGDPVRDLAPPVPNTAQRTALGNFIEVDLYWNRPTSNLSQLLGYGVYRATTPSGSSIAVDFLRDPETVFYQDLDDALQENRDYYYELTALNLRYPETSNSESNPSNRYGVRTLGDMIPLTPIPFPLTFRWQAAGSATGYYVFVWDRFPDFGVTEIWASPEVSGTSVQYNGPPLTKGNLYYYVILGVANDLDSRTISEIETFIAN